MCNIHEDELQQAMIMKRQWEGYLLITTILGCWIRGSVGNCLGNGLLSQSALKESALLLATPTRAPGKVQWLFPGIEFTCNTTITSMSYTTPMTSGKSKHPMFQVWRKSSLSGSLTYEQIEKVNGRPRTLDGDVVNVYTYSDLQLPVQGGDILGVYQPEIAMSGTRWSYQEGFGPVTYSRKVSAQSFAISDAFVANLTPLIFIGVTDQRCLTDSLEISALITKGRIFHMPLPSIDLAVERREQRIYPNIRFTCNGTITGILLALRQNLTADMYPEVHLWREGMQSIYTNIASISLAAARRTRDLYIYRVDLEEPAPFKEGDVIGLYLPGKEHNKFVVQFQPTPAVGRGTNSTLSYRQTAMSEVFDLSNTQLRRDYDIPMMVFELVADCNSLSNLSNGLVSVADSDAVGMKLASYSCLDGYELIGDATRTCTESGLWSGAEPLCEEIGGYLLANTTEERTNTTRGNKSTTTTIVFTVLGVFLGLVLCILVPLTVTCGVRLKLASSSPPSANAGTLTNPLYDGNYGYAFLRKFRASFRRKSSATCTSDEHYETASGFFSSQQEYDTPLTPYQVPISSIKALEGQKLSSSLPWDACYVPTAEQRSEGNVSYSFSYQGEGGNTNTAHFFQHSDIYWRPATNSYSLYEQLSRNKYREINREKIQIMDRLGSGNFGHVESGLWHSPVGMRQVAIKLLKANATEDDKVKFLQEAAINGQFHHRNVVNLIGVVTVGEPIMIILELMVYGDLRKFLIKNRPVPGEMVPPEMPYLLLRYCQQIASGMEYLSKKAFVHRDLAARNILVAEDKTCKIGDFGLARDLDDEQYYISHGGQVPVKWTAPEALYYKKYSTASDVWSFGAVMYEIWSLGRKPFEAYKNPEVIKMVDQGIRLHPPPGCPRNIYRLMIECWHPMKESRPSFSSLLQSFKQIGSLECAVSRDSCPQVSVLGGPLQMGEGMFQELNQAYIGQDFLHYTLSA